MMKYKGTTSAANKSNGEITPRKVNNFDGNKVINLNNSQKKRIDPPKALL
jgi:hypothetical protein